MFISDFEPLQKSSFKFYIMILSCALGSHFKRLTSDLMWRSPQTHFLYHKLITNFKHYHSNLKGFDRVHLCFDASYSNEKSKAISTSSEAKVWFLLFIIWWIDIIWSKHSVCKRTAHFLHYSTLTNTLMAPLFSRKNRAKKGLGGSCFIWNWMQWALSLSGRRERKRYVGDT